MGVYRASTGVVRSAWCGGHGWVIAAGVLAMLAASLPAAVGTSLTASAEAGECGPGSGEPVGPEPATPMVITEDCVDPRYNQPVVDSVETVFTPVPHVVVQGRFLGTPATFGFYFPIEQEGGFEYEERFIQGPVHQLRFTGENASEAEIALAVANGGYVVQVDPAQDYPLATYDHVKDDYNNTGAPADPALGGYRLPAAAAKYSRVWAQQVYEYEHRPVGIIYGGSGGGYMTISAAEQTIGVWDGFVPFVIGTPNSIPTVFTVRTHALRVLRQRDKFPCIVDAIDAGGSGDPYTSCDLNEEEAAALREATAAGFDPRAWFAHEGMSAGPLFQVALYAPLLDPTYAEDFWSEPGYLGTDPTSAGDSIRALRIQHPTTVVSASPPVPPPSYDTLSPDEFTDYMLSTFATGPERTIALESLPDGDLSAADLCMETGAAAGRCIKLGTVDRNTNTVTFAGGMDPELANSIAIGDQVRVDNGWALALETFGRHQVAPPDLGGNWPRTHGWDQYLQPSCDTKGRSGRCRGGITPEPVPIYPQRDVLTGPRGAYQASGSISRGRFDGKMIVAQSTMDIDAFPWQADWYRTKVEEHLGEGTDDQFRLWFTDHAQHGGGGGESTWTVSYRGTLDQALSALFAWIQDGEAPPATTSYEIVDGIIDLADTAKQRRGVQPVVELTVSSRGRPGHRGGAHNGTERTEVKVGEPVTLTASISVPPGAGAVVGAEWHQGTGTWQAADCVDCDGTRDTVTLQTTFTYTEAGTYFPVARGTSQREPGTAHGQIKNIDRARVVVTDQ